MLIAGMGYSQVKVVTNGDVKVGATGAAPLTELHVTGELALTPKGTNSIITGIRGGTNDQRLSIWNGGNNSQNAASYVTMNGTTSNSNFVFSAAKVDFLTNKAPGNFGVRAMEIHSGGEVTIGNNITPLWTLHVDGTAGKTGGGEFATVSDKRLKKNIKEYNLGLAEVLKIEPKTFNYIRDYGLNTSDTYVGVIAQEFQKIDPDNVRQVRMVEKIDVSEKSSDGSAPIHKTEIVREDDFLSVDGSSIKYMLINAIKEQQEMIEDQNSRIQELEKQLTNILSSNSQTNVTLEGTDEAKLLQNVPNPFGDSTRIDYEIPSNSESAEILIYNLSGQLIKRVDIDHVGKGSINLSAIGVESGNYTYSLTINNKLIATKKMLLRK